MLSLALFDTTSVKCYFQKTSPTVKEYPTVLVSDKDILISSFYYKVYRKDENITNLPGSDTSLLILMFYIFRKCQLLLCII